MENQFTGQPGTVPVTITEKLAAAKAVVTAKASGLGAEASWIPEILHFIIDILPEIISIFHPAKAEAVSTAPAAAAPAS